MLSIPTLIESFSAILSEMLFLDVRKKAFQEKKTISGVFPVEKNLERLWRDSDLIAICDSAEPNVQVWTSKEIAGEAV